ncbi:TetR/AcrR family transcriptional regulator [Streptomyces sp. NPDC058867]|uniref:TetR/AcrR family transcriptional regulator n=1 Tax=unclassified Streptomyces TaxID=2593676 RepID=UPI0036A8A163
MSANPVDRRAAIVRAGVGVLASQGPRGFTHRAIDRLLGWPVGTVGNYFPTRESLLLATAVHMVEEDRKVLEPPPDGVEGLDEISVLISERIRTAVDPEHRALFVARCELQLEALRGGGKPEGADAVRQSFIDIAATWLTRAHVQRADRHAPAFAAFVDGLMWDQIVYSGTAVPLTELHVHIADFLRGCAS